MRYPALSIPVTFCMQYVFRKTNIGQLIHFRISFKQVGEGQEDFLIPIRTLILFNKQQDESSKTYCRSAVSYELLSYNGRSKTGGKKHVKQRQQYILSPPTLSREEKACLGHSARLWHKQLNSTLFKMENAGKAGILCSLLLLFFSGNQIFATEIYTNIWAVKVHGGVQEVKKLAIRHGLSYERHVSKLSTVHLYTCKSFVSDSRIH